MTKMNENQNMLNQQDPHQIYFDAVQKYILDNNTENLSETDIDTKIKSLENDNIQAVINQDFNDRVKIEDCADKVIKMMNTNNAGSEDVINKAPDQLAGERGLNTMERRIMNYTDFVNESLNEKMANSLLQSMLEYKYPSEQVTKFVDEHQNIDFNVFTWKELQSFFENWRDNEYVETPELEYEYESMNEKYSILLKSVLEEYNTTELDNFTWKELHTLFKDWTYKNQ